MSDATDTEVEEYWLPLLKTDGQWDEAKIRNELHDLVFVLNQVSEVYDHITGGKLSSQMYYAEVIKAEYDDAISKAEAEALAAQRELIAALAGALEASEAWMSYALGILGPGGRQPPWEQLEEGREVTKIARVALARAEAVP